MARIIAVGQAAVEQSGEIKPIPAGTRIKVSVYDVKEGVAGPNSKNPGSPQFDWTAKVTEDGPYKGREIRYNYVPLDPNVGHAWNLAAFAKAVGWNITEEGGIEVPDDLRDLLGTELLVKVGQTAPDSENRVFNRVDRVYPLPKGGNGGGGGITEPAEKPTWDKLQ